MAIAQKGIDRGCGGNKPILAQSGKRKKEAKKNTTIIYS